MTRQDVDNLFKLLGLFRPGDRHLLDKALQSAWLLVLEPYETDDVREAVAEYFRGSKYWPDVTDIAKLCPKVPQDRSNRTIAVPSGWERQREGLERYAQLQSQRRAAGIPSTWTEAQVAGLSAMEWANQTSQVGLGVEGVL